MFNRDYLNKLDIVLIALVFLIIIFGILIIYSAGYNTTVLLNKDLYKKQIIWFIIGIIFMIVMTITDYRTLGHYALYIYGFLFFILCVTTFFSRTIRGHSSWLSFGFFSIQPSEFMKLSVVIVLAKYLELRERDIKKFKELLIPALFTFIPVIIILKQPDIGTSLIFVLVFFSMLFLGGADISHLVSIILIGVIAVVFPMLLTYWEWLGHSEGNLLVQMFMHVKVLFSVAGILFLVAMISFITNSFVNKNFLRRIYIPAIVLSLGLFLSVAIQSWFKDYQKKRLLVFLNPDLDPHGSGYNIIQSKIAIGSGGFFGKGFLHGTQTHLGFLPEKTTDFIFAVVSEEFGFIGAILLLVIFGIIIYRGINISLESKDKFGSLLALGIVSILFFHILVNIGMVIGLMPVTGLPLCFISYGGSNLFMIMIGIGILNNIYMNKSSY